ncbi:MAG TPA: MerR family transcriptional regulator, partial [Lactobacillus sp.]|nr:MerR family transcriptional regulator [Lactobacillus sp.]
RYYEKEHLIVPDRDQNNRRTYTDADQRWIAFIKRLKATGMPIKEIKTYAR